MVSVEHAIINDRQQAFRACVVKVLIMGVTIYNPPLMRPFLEVAMKEYNKKTTVEEQKLRNKLSAEADAKGLTRKDKGNYINPGCNAFRAERLKHRDAAVAKRTKELETEMP